MMQCRSIQSFQKERSISFHFPVTHLNSPTVFETQNAMVGSVLRLVGVPFETENNEVLNRL